MDKPANDQVILLPNLPPTFQAEIIDVLLSVLQVGKQLRTREVSQLIKGILPILHVQECDID